MGIIGLFAIRRVKSDKKVVIAQSPTQPKNANEQAESERIIIDNNESYDGVRPSIISDSLTELAPQSPPNSPIHSKEVIHSQDLLVLQNMSKGLESPSRNANDDSYINIIPTKGISSSNTAAAAEETIPRNRHTLKESGRASRYIKPPDFKVIT